MAVIRALLFDLFDTLVDLPMTGLPRHRIGGQLVPTTSGVVHATLQRHADVDFETFTKALRDVDRQCGAPAHAEGREFPTPERFASLLDRLGIRDPGGSLAGELTGTHMGMLVALVRTPAHHASLLASLRTRVALGVCSNWTWTPSALAILESAGMRTHFKALAISHDIGIRKPRPEIFAAALAGLEVAPEEVLHVGDNLVADVLGAAALGIRTVWITRCVADPDAARARAPSARPDWTIRDLAELPAILDGDGDGGTPAQR
jgi:FMN phosphatase YigB (HAD superfamily)